MSFFAYKGFDKDLKCRGFQYEIGKTYSIPEKPEVCVKGFHCCTKLSDVFFYYPPWISPLPSDGTLRKSDDRFCVVEVLGDVSMEPYADNSKLATNKIAIVRELHLPDMLRIIERESKNAHINGIYLQGLENTVRDLWQQ